MAKTFNIWKYQITQGLKVESISVSKMPDKLNYYVGDSFDPTGMEITATFDNGITGIVTGYTWSPNIISKDTSSITISYSNGSSVVTTTIEITLEDKPVEIPYTNSSFTYDGSSHDPIWINYNPDAMIINGTTSAINAGTYTVTFTLKNNYKWSDGTKDPISINWTIDKAPGTLYVSETSIQLDENNTSATIITDGYGGTITASSSDTNVATVAVEDSMITIESTPTAKGTAIITVNRLDSQNYTESPSVDISISKIIIWTRTGSYNIYGTYSHIAKGTSAVAIIIGAGGGGGSGNYGGQTSEQWPVAGLGGAGGKAGEVILTSEIAVTKGKSYNVVVGRSGSGGGDSSAPSDGKAGGSSSVFGFIANGGDGGAMGGFAYDTINANGTDGAIGGLRGSVSFAGITWSAYDGCEGGSGGSGSSINENPYHIYFGGNGGSGPYRSSGGDGGRGAYKSSATAFAAGNAGTNGATTSIEGNGGGGGGGGGGGMRTAESSYAKYGGYSHGGSGSTGYVIIYEKGVD